MELRFNWKKEQKLKRIATEWKNGFLEIAETSREDLQPLEMALVGHIVFEGMPSYEESCRSKGHSSHQQKPKLIVYCEVINDVWLCLEWAHKLNYWVTCRSGGHSTENYSLNSGMVIDVSGLSYVLVNRHTMQAHVGAGTQFHELNTTLDTYKVHVPSGGCPDVAVGGYMMGGGYGFTSRECGIQSDSVIAITMMLSNGNIVVADHMKNRDLYWAVRGGTGNNFGVLLEVTYQLYDLHTLWGFVLQWPIEQAADALVALQENYMKTGASPKLGHQLVLTHRFEEGKAPKPIFAMAGMYHGSREEGLEAIKELRNVGTPTLEIDVIDTYNKLNDLVMGFMPGMPEVTKPVYEEKDGGYIADAIDKEGWQKIVDVYLTTPNPLNIAYCEVYGGVINTFPVKDSTFIHRDNYCDLYIDSFWSEDPKLPDEKSAKEWLDNFMEVLRPFLSGHKYQNYPKRQLPDFRWAYWGDAYNSLLFVKRKYDPENFFNFEQSITAYPEDNGINRSTAPSMFSDMEIVFEPYSKSFHT